MKRYWTIAAALCLVSCGPPQYTLSTTLDENAAAYINQRGTARVAGQAFMRTMVGEVRYAAGSTVYLLPVTAYTRERIGLIYKDRKCSESGGNFTNDDPRLARFERRQKANGEGRFAFDGVAAGQYFVVTQVRWAVPTQYGALPQGCAMYTQVHVDDGQAVEVIMDGT